MSQEKTKIYQQFVAAVKKEDTAKAAELLFQHEFIIAKLEDKSEDLDNKTAIDYAIDKESDQLIRVLYAFGATTELVPNLKSLRRVLESPAEKEGVTKDYFLNEIEQLYILTGVRPHYCDRTINVDKKGRHLRFTFSDNASDDFKHTALRLKLFGVASFNSLAKAGEYYITIDPIEFVRLQSIFLKNSEVTLRELEPIETAAAQDLFFTDFEARNKVGKFDLLTLSRSVTSYFLRKSPCVQYAHEHGDKFTHTKALFDEKPKTFLPSYSSSLPRMPFQTQVEEQARLAAEKEPKDNDKFSLSLAERGYSYFE